MEQFYEQTVLNKNIDERAKKTKTLAIAQTVCLMLGVFVLVTSAMYITFFWVFILFSIPFFFAYFVINRINKRNNTEYDYTLDDEYLKISAVYYRKTRKPIYTVRLRTVVSVGVFGSDGYKKIEHTANKKILALVNYDAEDAIMYICHITDKGKNILFIEPDRGFIIALRRAVSAIELFDGSIKDLEKRLNEAEV